jgi:hypothetical protein
MQRWHQAVSFPGNRRRRIPMSFSEPRSVRVHVASSTISGIDDIKLGPASG